MQIGSLSASSWAGGEAEDTLRGRESGLRRWFSLRRFSLRGILHPPLPSFAGEAFDCPDREGGGRDIAGI